jgi:hypothetical protein
MARFEGPGMTGVPAALEFIKAAGAWEAVKSERRGGRWRSSCRRSSAIRVLS